MPELFINSDSYRVPLGSEGTITGCLWQIPDWASPCDITVTVGSVSNTTRVTGTSGSFSLSLPYANGDIVIIAFKPRFIGIDVSGTFIATLTEDGCGLAGYIGGDYEVYWEL